VDSNGVPAASRSAWPPAGFPPPLVPARAPAAVLDEQLGCDLLCGRAASTLVHASPNPDDDDFAS
jgi:hypothetical protein